MDTTTFFPSTINMHGAQYVDFITAALFFMATIAIIVLISVYVCAGICKRVR